MTSLSAVSLRSGSSVRHGRSAFPSFIPASGLLYTEHFLSLCSDCSTLRFVSALYLSVRLASAIVTPVLADISNALLPLVRLDTHIDNVELDTAPVYTDGSCEKQN